jgi:hypothetical protein
VVVGFEDDMLPDKLNMRSINQIAHKDFTWLAKELEASHIGESPYP